MGWVGSGEIVFAARVDDAPLATVSHFASEGCRAYSPNKNQQATGQQARCWPVLQVVGGGTVSGSARNAVCILEVLF